MIAAASASRSHMVRRAAAALSCWHERLLRRAAPRPVRRSGRKNHPRPSPPRHRLAASRSAPACRRPARWRCTRGASRCLPARASRALRRAQSRQRPPALRSSGDTTPGRPDRQAGCGPWNFAATGPTRAVIVTWNSVSDTRSIDSQPGMHACSVSGSLSAAQVASTDAGTVRELFSSIAAAPRCHATRRAPWNSAARAPPRGAGRSANAAASCFRLSRLCMGRNSST